jgi:hypothetical protein
MAPDLTFGRNEQAEGRKPVLIDEMLERHRRRIDGVIDIMDALLIRRIDAERMQSGPVLRGRNDLALRERGRQAPLIGDDRQIRRLVEGDPNALAGHRQGVAQTAPEVPQWRANGVSPGCMQRSIDANELFVFDSVARHDAPLGVRQVPIRSISEGRRPRDSAAGLCPKAPAAARPPYPPRSGPPA